MDCTAQEYTQYLTITYNEKESEKDDDIYIHIYTHIYLYMYIHKVESFCCTLETKTKL